MAESLMHELEGYGIAGWLDPWLGLWALLFASGVANLDFHRRFQRSIQGAPRLNPQKSIPDDLPSVSVIIPAYNEAVNIAGCMESVLSNKIPDGSQMTLIVADDESTDDTRAIAQEIAATDSRVTVFTVPPRPTDKPWRGKNWACAQAVKRIDSEYLLFIDADVRLAEDAIAAALIDAQNHNVDLLSCGPKIVCNCFSEWLVQPLMALMIAVGFSFDAVNDPSQKDTAMAAGPFMLFRTCAYEKIGGHAAVATEAVEDVRLAETIKSYGLSLRLVLGIELVSVRMYRSFSGLWEGWTKNFYLAVERNPFLAVAAAIAVFLLFCVPWLGFAVGLVGLLLAAPAAGVTVGLSAVAIAAQMFMRIAAAQQTKDSLRYLYLTWLGGGIISAIAIVSMVKTETGWGWTWKGRSLAAPTIRDSSSSALPD